ncbi:hypothetical protein E0T48_002312 [Enterococcus faecalis]|nr:hypothetical protein [Enterococcus faecalis]EHK9982044.1 hypothetical protein [Enterococcus faecalis]HAP3815452.1 hypothetical protein [Enterococcus faecalis]HAP3825327.1 hypothetical protein [Enterococcus faecalis]
MNKCKLLTILWGIGLSLVVVPCLYTIIAYFMPHFYNNILYLVMKALFGLGQTINVVGIFWYLWDKQKKAN